MTHNAVYVRILLVLIAVVVFLAFISRSPRETPANTWLPSSFNPVGAGHMAFFQALQESGWPAERWRDPLSRLSAEGLSNTLIITRSRVGARVSFSAEEISILVDWVARGNTLVLLGALTQWDDTRQLLSQLGFNLPINSNPSSFGDLFHPLENRSTEKLQISATTPDGEVGTMVIPSTAPLPSPYPAGARILAQRGSQPYLLDLTYGSGHVLYGPSAQLLSNAYLRQGDNLALVLHLLAPNGQVPKHLIFEESHHGFSAVFALARLLDHPGVQFGGMLALLGVLTFLGSSLIRFGPIVPLETTRGRSTLEFVDSIADLYERADLRNDMIGYLFRETHQRILSRLHLPATAPHELIADRLHKIHPELPGWKKLAQRFDSRDYMNGLPPSGWLRVARELIQIKSAMA